MKNEHFASQEINQNIETKESSPEKFTKFLEAIDRPDLKEKLKPETPFGYMSMEFYGEGIQGGGGLGMLASDTFREAKRLGLPLTTITPFYPEEKTQSVDANFNQQTDVIKVTPEERGFSKIGKTNIKTLIENKEVEIEIDIYEKKEGSVRIVAPTEKNFGALYQGTNNSDHRMYQEISLSIGGYKALKEIVGINPSIYQLNEAPTVFSAIARLDDKMQKTSDLNEALKEIRKNTIYTNHTLVQAVEAEFTIDQFERFLMPNIKSNEVKNWLREKINKKGNVIKLSTLAIELSDKRNGVSLLHAKEAGKTYKDYDGNPINFEGITNGISIERWGNPEMIAYLEKTGVIDENQLPAKDFDKKIDELDNEKLKDIKDDARKNLYQFLTTRKNQYNESINIPKNAKIIDWKRRMAGYKRPGMIFDNPEKFAEILNRTNSYFIMAGKAHQDDQPMQNELKRILEIVDKNPILKNRVHFVQNYDEPLARTLAQGSDISLNTPQIKDSEGRNISTEACGTSWEKDILGNCILISTPDGGVADPIVVGEENKSKNIELPILEISGKTYAEEVSSLYNQLNKAENLIAEDGEEYHNFIKNQLKGYLPIICGSRMEKDYLNLGFPKE
jgi:starch phosphorylase